MPKQDKLNKEYNGLSELLNTESMVNYNNYIVGMAFNAVKSAEHVVDFGAGIGTLTSALRDKYKTNPTCVEIDSRNKEFLTQKDFMVLDDLSLVQGKCDLIFSSNVLEHIEDDIATLKMMRKKIKYDGKIVLYLPAKMILWSLLDEEVGHYRRYEIDELKRKCEQANLRIDALHFADSLGFFAGIAMKVFGYNKASGIGSLRSLKFYDKWLLPISKILDAMGFRHFLGKNIVLVASKN